MPRFRHQVARPARGEASAPRERGAVLVEAAFVLPILVIFVFGIIEWGMVFNNVSVAGSATRSGARLTSHAYAPAPNKATHVSDIGDALERDLQSLNNAEPIEAWVYRANTTTAPTTCTSSTRCWRMTWNTTTDAFNTPTGGWSDPVACGSNLDDVAVMVRVRHDFYTRVFGTSRTVSQRTVMRIEPISSDVC